MATEGELVDDATMSFTFTSTAAVALALVSYLVALVSAWKHGR